MRFKGKILIELNIDAPVIDKEMAKKEMNDNSFITRVKTAIDETMRDFKDDPAISYKIPEVKVGIYED